MIHVFGSPEADAMEPDESFCCEATENLVTYHVQPRATARGWMCAACGYEGWDEDMRLAS